MDRNCEVEALEVEMKYLLICSFSEFSSDSWFREMLDRCLMGFNDGKGSG
jgi:hypothetical protein